MIESRRSREPSAILNFSAHLLHWAQVPLVRWWGVQLEARGKVTSLYDHVNEASWLLFRKSPRADLLFKLRGLYRNRFSDT